MPPPPPPRKGVELQAAGGSFVAVEGLNAVVAARGEGGGNLHLREYGGGGEGSYIVIAAAVVAATY